MKYTTNGVTQDQYIRVSPEKKIDISPKGGELTPENVKLIIASPYGKELIEAGMLKIEGNLPAPAPVSPEKPKTSPGPAQVEANK
jgi:hypothetical protein